MAWKVKELFADVTRLVTEIKSNDSVWVEKNIPSQLSHIRSSLVSLITGVTRHQRTAATHILVFMISSEERRKKPYALPVQCLPYKGLANSTVRDLVNAIIREMSKRHMKVAGEVIILEVSKSSDYGYLFLGFVTDGEWNSLCTKGNTRPLSVLQIRADVRTKYSHMRLKKITGMLTPLCMYIFLSLMHITKVVAFLYIVWHSGERWSCC